MMTPIPYECVYASWESCSLADFLVARLLTLGSHPTRKAMTRGIGYLQGMGSQQGPHELDGTSTGGGDEHQSQSECCAPVGPGPGGCPLEEGMALHPGPSWEAPPTFQAARRPSRVALRLGVGSPWLGRWAEEEHYRLLGQAGSATGSLGCHVLRSHPCFVSPRMAPSVLAPVGLGLSAPGLAVIQRRTQEGVLLTQSPRKYSCPSGNSTTDLWC